MNQHEAPTGMVATLGHPANENLIVKTAQGPWRYVSSGQIVDDEDFRGGWDEYHVEPLRSPTPEEGQRAYGHEYMLRAQNDPESIDRLLLLAFTAGARSAIKNSEQVQPGGYPTRAFWIFNRNDYIDWRQKHERGQAPSG